MINREVMLTIARVMLPIMALIIVNGCAPMQSPLTEVCAIKVVRVIDDATFVVVEHCEPNGEKV